jgi:hypothetical protein
MLRFPILSKILQATALIQTLDQTTNKLNNLNLKHPLKKYHQLKELQLLIVATQNLLQEIDEVDIFA